MLKIKLNLTQQKYHLISGQMFSLLFFIIFSSCNGFPTETVSEKICRTSECNQTASRILEYMDATINPCDNFYEFACGNYVKNAKIPDNLLALDGLNDAANQAAEQSVTLVDVEISPNMPKHSKLIRDFYNICMNETTIEKNGSNSLKDKFKKLGGWPVVEGSKWNASAFNWINSVKIIRELGYHFDYFFNLEFTTYRRNRTRLLIQLKPPTLRYDFLTAPNGLEDERVKDYKKAMVDVAVFLGADREFAESELTEVLIFEMKLANLTSRNKGFHFHHSWTVSELVKVYSRISMLEYLNISLGPYVDVSKNSTILNDITYYLHFFQKLLNTTSKRTQANYILWRVFLDSVDYLSDEYPRPITEPETSMKRQNIKLSRSIRCKHDVRTLLEHNIGAHYIKKYFTENSKKSVTQMVNNIQNQLKTILQTLDWMDEETKKNSINKVNALISCVGYPDQLLDNNEMNTLYKNFELHENISYLDAVLMAKLFDNNRLIQSMKGSFDMNCLNLNPITDDLAYNIFYNTINIPAAILQRRFYDVNRPQYMNYGGIGNAIAHEFTHGFDTVGKLYDEYGNEFDRWGTSTNKEFKKRVSCLENQYSNYTVKEVGMNVNGLRTIRDNIADNGGAKLAYLAYKNWTSLNGPEPGLLGLERFSSNQMFWISTAHTWCTVQRPEYARNYVNSNTHSPAEFRIIGSFSNLREFSDDFKCPLKSPMNPKNKCEFW